MLTRESQSAPFAREKWHHDKVSSGTSRLFMSALKISPVRTAQKCLQALPTRAQCYKTYLLLFTNVGSKQVCPWQVYSAP
jgi:hypothetical protein